MQATSAPITHPLRREARLEDTAVPALRGLLIALVLLALCAAPVMAGFGYGIGGLL